MIDINLSDINSKEDVEAVMWLIKNQRNEQVINNLLQTDLDNND